MGKIVDRSEKTRHLKFKVLSSELFSLAIELNVA